MTNADEIRQMEKLAQKILDTDGPFEVTAEDHYAVIEYPPIIFDFDAPTPPMTPKDPEKRRVVHVDLKQPAWPSPNTANDYRATAKVLYSAAKAKELPYHVSLTEILRCIDCRLAELFFFCGLNPANYWNMPKRQLSWSKKLKLAKKVLPRPVIPEALLRDLSETRNITEHQFYEPSRSEVVRCRETMDVFLEMTDGLIGILFYQSMFKYQLEKAGPIIVMQIMRDNGSILLMHKGDVPPLRRGIPADGVLGISLIEKVIREIKWYLDNDPKFKSNLGF